MHYVSLSLTRSLAWMLAYSSVGLLFLENHRKTTIETSCISSRELVLKIAFKWKPLRLDGEPKMLKSEASFFFFSKNNKTSWLD